MIHNTILYRPSTRKILARQQYWPLEVDPRELVEFVSTRADLRASDSSLREIPLIVGDSKFTGADCGSDLLLVFVADQSEDEHSLQERIAEAAKSITSVVKSKGLDAAVSGFAKIVESSVVSRLKIALVGEGGVGKTTTLHLLLGDTPPLQYVPTIALNLETVENIRFGSYSLVIWDFAGQERFRTLWRFYFHGADVIFLVCDSTLRNVIISKDILKLIRRDAPKVPVFAIANKQDKPNAMKPEVVQKILGIPTYPMVAIDKAKRDEMLRILMTAAAQYVGISLPDMPATDLLRFADEAAKRASAAKPEPEGEAEEVEVVEEVLVDEDGNVIEDGEEFEIIEEVVEEVEEVDEADEVPAELSKTEQKPVAPESALDDASIEVGGIDEELIASESDEVITEVEGTEQKEETSVKVEEEKMSIAEAAVETGPATDAEILIDIAVEEKNTDGTDMAVEIITQQLGEDEMISEELKTATPDQIDEALGALSCDEVLAPDGVVQTPDTVRKEAKAELDRILGQAEESSSTAQKSEEKSSSPSEDKVVSNDDEIWIDSDDTSDD